jgi:hypothetical protein
MRKWMGIAAIGLVMSLGVWFGLAASASPSQRHAPSTRNGQQSVVVANHASTVSLHQAASTSKQSTKGSSTAADEGGTESESSGEGSGGTESDTHEDPDGVNVDHQCPPDCDTANGENP